MFSGEAALAADLIRNLQSQLAGEAALAADLTRRSQFSCPGGCAGSPLDQELEVAKESPDNATFEHWMFFSALANTPESN